MKRSTKAIGISAALGVILISSVAYLNYRQKIMWKYKDPAKEISIKYPANWKPMPGYGGAKVVFASPFDGQLDYFQENVSVVIQDISKHPASLREYSDEAIYQMELVFKHNFILEETTAVATLSGYPAYKLIFTGKGPDTELRYYMTWCVVDEVTAYQITYTAFTSQFDKYYPQVQKMVASFKILK